jgi:hypothetical protein
VSLKRKTVVVGLALLSVFALSVVFANGTPKLFLSTQSFSQQIAFTYGTRSIPNCCGVNYLTIWNFTVDLSNRDPGSTWGFFKMTIVAGTFFVRASDLSNTTSFGYWASKALVIPGASATQQGMSWDWRFLSPGTYAIVDVNDLTNPSSLTANMTWTQATIV